MGFNNISSNDKKELSVIRFIIENIKELVFLINKDGSIKYANEETSQFLGFNSEKIHNMKIYEIETNSSFEKWNNFLNDLKEKRFIIYENNITLENGKLISVEIRSNFLMVNNNEYDLRFIKDISERKSFENLFKNHQRSEIEFRSIIETASEGVILVDEHLKTTYVNQRLVEMLGYGKEEMLIRSFNEFIYEEDLQDHIQKIANRQKNISENYERRLRKKDGIIIWTHISGSPILNEYGQYVGSFAIITDISERKKSENEILKLNRIYLTLSTCNETLVQSTNENDLLKKICEIIVKKGQYKMAWVGYAQNDVDKTVKPIAYAGGGKTYLENIKISWADNQYGKGPTGTAIRTGKLFVLNYLSGPEFSIWREEASKQGFHSSAAFPLTIDNYTFGALNIYSEKEQVFDETEVNLLQGLVSDLAYGISSIRTRNEIHKLNQNLENRVAERTSQLELLNKDLEAFSYTVSHDLRSPLRRIIEYAQLLKEDYDKLSNTERIQFIIKILESSFKMDKLIDDIFAFSSMGFNELISSEIILNQLVQNVISDFKPDIKNRSIDWIIENLPVIKGDKNLIRVVFVNLISNALKFTKKQDHTVITIGYRENISENIFFIRDNGVGFNMSDSIKLFNVFQRLHSDNTFEGTGIGLATVQRIINRHGGRIWAESEIEKGATFYFSLPIY